MNNNFVKISLCIVLVFTMLMAMVSFGVFAANTPDVNIIKEVSVSGVQTPYVGEHPDYTSKLGSPSAYTYDDQLDGDPDVFDGKWWYDETAQMVVMSDDTFKEGHVYTFTLLLVANEGYEFRVDNYNTPFISAYVNGNKATVYDNLTDRSQAMVEYTFEPCDYNYEISEVNVNVTEPVPGGYPDFNIEIDTAGVVKDSLESPYYIYGVAWYDCKTHTFMNPSDPFEEDGVYEANIVLTTIGDYFFATKNDKTDVIPYINGKEGVSDGAGANDRYKILVSYIFGDAREEVSYVEVTNIKEPAVGANPIFTATPVNNTFSVTGIFWTDVTNSTAVSLKETDTFIAGRTYNLEVWIRANDKYKFSTDEDGYIDIMALVGGHQADVMIPGSEISAELSLTFTLSDDRIVSFVDVIEVNTPVAGEAPDRDAFCITRGCNVSKVEWYDVTEGRGALMAEDAVFEAGRKYTVVVRVDAEGDYTYELDDMNVNVAEGTINGEKAIAYSSYDNTYLELGLEFAPCEGGSDNPTNPTEPNPSNPTDPDNPTNPTNPTTPSPTGILGDADLSGVVNVKDATAIQKHVASIITLSDTALVLADADGNTTVNVKDATAIQKWVAGIETGFSIGQPV